jgi:hypothetical protein
MFRPENAVVKLAMMSLLCLVLDTAAMAVTREHGDGLESASPVQEETSFSLTRLPEDPNQYSLVVSGPDERTISGPFTVDRLLILRGIMTEAEKFALTEEGVGMKDPITTRFTDSVERAFIVDVQKAGNQSLLFLTLTTEQGRLTVDAGRINRSTRRKEGFFFELLSRLESILPKPPAQTSK